MALDALVRFFETLTVENLCRFPDFYAEGAYFKDPFNEVRGIDAIRRIFHHMFRQLEAPRFLVTERVVDACGAMLVWELHYGTRTEAEPAGQLIRGVSHLRFDPDGKVVYHRDYWDTAEELYERLPGLGLMMRALKRFLRA